MEEKKYCIRCFAGVVDNDMVYIYNNSLHLIMRYNLMDFSYKIIGQPQDYMSYNNPIISMLKYKEYLYLIMFRRLGIIRFSLTDKGIEKYLMNDSLLSPNELTWKCFLFNDEIWMFSVCASREIIVFDCNTGKFRKQFSLADIFARKNVRIESKACLSNIFRINHRIWGAVCGTKYVFSIDMNEVELKIFTVNCNSINSFDYNESEFWITVSNSNRVIRWNPDYGVGDTYYAGGPGDLNFSDYPECYVCGVKSSILVVTNSERDFYLIDKKTRETAHFPFTGWYQRLGTSSKTALFGDYLRTNSTLILLPYDIDQFVVFDLEDKTFHFAKSTLSKTDYENVYIMNSLASDMVEEDLQYGLLDYITYVKKAVYHLNPKGINRKIGKEIIKEV